MTEDVTIEGDSASSRFVGDLGKAQHRKRIGSWPTGQTEGDS
jgi:hypothetical protein